MTHAVNRNLEKIFKINFIVLKQEYLATIQNGKKKLEYYSSFFFRKTGSNICKERHTILTILKWKISARDFLRLASFARLFYAFPFVHRKHSPENLDH